MNQKIPVVVASLIAASLTAQCKQPGSIRTESEMRYLNRPNILIIMTDQQRTDMFNFTSDGFFDTPNWEKLAKSGVIFDNAYSSAPICIPSRSSILTGLEDFRYQKTPGDIWDNLTAGTWTFARELQAGGYETAAVGKMHWNPIHSDNGFDYLRLCEHIAAWPYGPNDRDDYVDWLSQQGKESYLWRLTHKFEPSYGYDANNPENVAVRTDFSNNDQSVVFYDDKYYHPTEWVKRETINYLNNARNKSKPFMLFASFPHPHQPYDPPEPYASMYDWKEFQLPKVDADINAHLAPDAKQIMDSGGLGGLPGVKTATLNKEVQQKMSIYQKALIKGIDDAIGEILQNVDLNNTVVIYTSDHGDYYGQRGYMLKTPGMPFDDLVKIPLYIAGAGIKPGHVSNVVANYDIALTCLEMAHIPVPSPGVFNTKSLVPYLSGAPIADDRFVYSGSDNQCGWSMMRYQKYKYMFCTRPGVNQEMLFNIETDPKEKWDLLLSTPMASADLAMLALLRDEMQKRLAQEVAPKIK